MNIKIGVIVAFFIIIAAVFWAFDSIRQRSYEGSNLKFGVGSGSVSVTNNSDEALPVQMRAPGRGATFSIESPELNLKQKSASEGSGRNIAHVVNFDLAPGTSVINITRGSNIEFISSSEIPVQAVVTPLTQGQVPLTLMAATAVVLAAVFYISSSNNHKLAGKIGRKLPLVGSNYNPSTV